jgi:hypothetical protein
MRKSVHYVALSHGYVKAGISCNERGLSTFVIFRVEHGSSGFIRNVGYCVSDSTMSSLRTVSYIGCLSTNWLQ